MIKLVVEGHGEAGALPVLLRRIAQECFGVWDPPLVRLTGRYHSSRLLRNEGGAWKPGPDLAKAGGHARNEGASCILVLLDQDDGCAKEVTDALAANLGRETGIEPSALVLAVREYEAWFLASAETLGYGVPPFPRDPESVRDAKGHLEAHLELPFPYDEKADQPKFSARLDLALVYDRCRSFRKLVKEFRKLLISCGLNPVEWPMAS